MAKDQELYLSCLKNLRAFQALLESEQIAQRLRGQWNEQLFTLLQFLTINFGSTLENATHEQIHAWLEPSRGFSEFETRRQLLFRLRKLVANPALDPPAPQRGELLRKLAETVFWGCKWRKISREAKAYFDSIGQDDILRAEQACVPFYRAYHEAFPSVDEVDVFSDSDLEVVSKVKALAKEPEVKSIADLGCGGGRLLKKLGEEFPGAKLTGTSIFQFTPQQAEELRKHRIEPLYTSASHTGLPDASQDIVVSTEVLEHLRHPEEMVREIARILKPGGVYCITAPSRNASMFCKNPLSYLAVAVGAYLPAVLPPFPHLYAPLTRIPIVHYGFDLGMLKRMFRPHFSKVQLETSRFVSLRKFRLDRVASRIPILRKMGGLCVVSGRK